MEIPDEETFEDYMSQWVKYNKLEFLMDDSCVMIDLPNDYFNILDNVL